MFGSWRWLTSENHPRRHSSQTASFLPQHHAALILVKAKPSPAVPKDGNEIEFSTRGVGVIYPNAQSRPGCANRRSTAPRNVGAAAAGAVRHGLSGVTGYGGAMWALGKAFRSTAWRTVSSATKASIADALVSGDFGQVMNTLGKAGLTGQMATASEDTSDWVPIQTSDGQQLLIHPEDLEESTVTPA